MAKILITVEGEPTEVVAALRELLGTMAVEVPAAAAPAPVSAPTPPAPVEVATPAAPASAAVAPAGIDAPPVRRGRGRPPKTPRPDTSWTYEGLRKLWAELTTGAREALAGIAAHDGVATLEEMKTHLGTTMRHGVNGRLSSLGFAVKRLKVGDRESLYTYDTPNHTYRMTPQTTSLVRRIVDEDAEAA